MALRWRHITRCLSSHPARIGSRKTEQWTAFAKSLKAQPSILAIVCAGNDSHDIDRERLWLALDNFIVVTSTDAFGRLGRGSNWGTKSVDIMLVAENVPVVDFRGAKGKASGSSYAVPHQAALTARILTKQPTLKTTQLKARIFERATQFP